MLWAFILFSHLHILKNEVRFNFKTIFGLCSYVKCYFFVNLELVKCDIALNLFVNMHFYCV